MKKAFWEPEILFDGFENFTNEKKNRNSTQSTRI